MDETAEEAGGMKFDPSSFLLTSSNALQPDSDGLHLAASCSSLLLFSPNSLLLGFSLRKKRSWPQSLAAPVNAVFGCCPPVVLFFLKRSCCWGSQFS